MTTDTLYCLLPELILLLTGTAVYLGGAFVPSRRLWLAATLVAILAAWVALRQQDARLLPPGDSAPLSVEVSGPLAIDKFGMALRGLTLAVGFLFALVLGDAGKRANRATAAPHYACESLGSLLMILSGLMITAMARDLVLLFAGLELVSIPTYVLLFLGRRNDSPAGVAASHEAAAKYFFLSILSSAVMLYGFSFLYGIGGSTELVRIAAVLAEQAADGAKVPNEALFALVLIFVGLGFRLAAVPFHYYAPDVYQGTSHANAGLLSVAPKIASIGVLVRLLATAMPATTASWRMALIVAVLTMTLGNLAALWQNHLRRLLAYSSIAHGGYLLIGVTAALAGSAAGMAEGRQLGLSSAVLYVGVYAIATTGAFAVLAHLSHGERPVETVDDLAGLGKTHPLAAVLLAVFAFSLAGIPPLAGFWGKLWLINGALRLGLNDATPEQAWLLGLTVVAVLNAAIACAYYLRLVSVMYFRPPAGEASPAPAGSARMAGLLAAIIVLAIGVFPRLLTDTAARAGRSLPATQVQVEAPRAIAAK